MPRKMLSCIRETRGDTKTDGKEADDKRIMGHLNIFIAFVAGLASFLSPCVFPLVPSYLAQLVGPSVMEAAVMRSRPAAPVPTAEGTVTLAAPAASGTRHLPLWHSVAFVGGFSAAFIALGATASTLGALLKHEQQSISEIGGLVLIVMGLHFAGVIHIPFLNRERRVRWRPAERSFGASFAIGIIFALGWTPCIGIILGSILAVAEQSATLQSGVILLTAYSLGLGAPFLLMGAAFERAAPLLRRLSPHIGTIERVTGVIIAVMGLLIFNGWLITLNHYFTFLLPGI